MSDVCTSEYIRGEARAGELQNIRARFAAGENPTQLLDEMESVFKVPAMKSNKFNRENPEIIALYIEIGLSRKELFNPGNDSKEQDF